MAGDNNISGSIRKLTLNSVTYDVLHDANFDIIGSGYENTALPTSGDAIRKMQKRVKAIESVIVKANGAEKEALTAGADDTKDIPMAFTTAAGDTYRAVGFYEFAKLQTEELRAELKLYPRNSKGWQPFLV